MDTFKNCLSFNVKEYTVFIIEDTSLYRKEIAELEEEVFYIASLSRGWNSEEDFKTMRDNFKIDPLYHATSLALITKNNKLYGTCGVINNWHIENSSIMHLCSVNFHPEIQKSNIFSIMFTVLWLVNVNIPKFRKNYTNDNIFATAISQSPFILRFFNTFFDTFPSPSKIKPDSEFKAIANIIASKFNPDLKFYEDSFLIKNECNFFYKNIPYTNNKLINEYCKKKLDINNGDVFVIVGKLKKEIIKTFVEKIFKKNKILFNQLNITENSIQNFLNL